MIKLHHDILKVIKQHKYKIFVDCGVCRISDRFFLNQCYQCQQFGHRSGSCSKSKSNEYVCRFCAASHKSSTCTYVRSKNKEILKCANCNGNHSSTDHVCSVLQKQLNFVISRTKGMENTLKNSIPRKAIVT